MKECLPATSDTIFKSLFGNQKNSQKILIPFLRAVWPLPEDDYEHVVLLKNSPDEASADGKGSVLDICVRTARGKLIDIEIQRQAQSAQRERFLFYAAKLFASQAQKGIPYRELKPAYGLLITEFTLIGENRDYHNRWQFRNPKDNALFSDILEISTLELPKLPKEEDGQPLWRWLEFLKLRNKEELDMLAHRHEDLREAVEQLTLLSEDADVRRLYDLEFKRETDFANRQLDALEKGWSEGLAKGLAEGREEGREEGLAESRQAIARNMLNGGFAPDLVARMTGLSADEIAALGPGPV
ncbi:MAG: Rpn family recombination-promoting nuclease/putative transposase [Zoogloeaceae bacterium]|jgi:predicted transposase/invertase (TIGR01784 family)|nr:Rpn family recombination-promoting nuclease/putative transposase [Zoogloeaceae bacterium]